MNYFPNTLHGGVVAALIDGRCSSQTLAGFVEAYR